MGANALVVCGLLVVGSACGGSADETSATDTGVPASAVVTTVASEPAWVTRPGSRSSSPSMTVRVV